MTTASLLSGPDTRDGAESGSDHARRLGTRPRPGSELIDELERSGLRGRGGAAFPVAAKWRAVAAQPGRPVVLVNGAEGEPLSRKDRLLMETRPHLVLDGAALAAEAVGADEVVVYVAGAHALAAKTLAGALRERRPREGARTRLVVAPSRYVSGEETAAVHFVNDGVAQPLSLAPRPFERGVGGRPTLVQNVESLAHVAMIARDGASRFADRGRRGATGTVLLTLSGAGVAPGVVEVAHGSTAGEAVAAAGGSLDQASAVLLGGYFGGWVSAGEAATLPLDAALLRGRGMSLGCGVLALLPHSRCGVTETARVMTWLAGQSARQCGPCAFGLRAIADATTRVARGVADEQDLDRLRRWSGELAGRGACRHPDGATGFLLSSLRVFDAEYRLHQERRRCSTAVELAEAA